MADKLKKVVIFGYPDIAVAGCRCLLAADENQTKFELTVPSIDLSKRNSVLSDGAEDLPPFTHQRLEDREVSLITVNCHLEAGLYAHICNFLMDLSSESKIKEFVIVTAVHLKGKTNETELYQACLNCEPVKDIPALTKDAPINDVMLNNLIQFLQVERIPTRCLLVPGHRAATGCPNKVDGSLQTIITIQNTLGKLYGLAFSLDKAKQLKYTKADSSEDSQSLIYM